MSKEKKYILIAVAAVAVILIVKSKRIADNEDATQSSGIKGVWAGLVDAIGNTMEKGNDSFTRMAQAIYEEKRQNEREDYARFRDAKDNSAIFSNDMLIY